MNWQYGAVACILMAASCTKPGSGVTDPTASDVQLDPPPAGQGVQIGIPPFNVPQGQEIQRDYYLNLPSSRDIYVNRFQFAYNPGSHHCNVFKSDSLVKTPGTFDDTFTSLDYTKWDMFTASQRDSFDWRLPPGVAVKLRANQQVCIQSHYVNAATQSTPMSRAKVLINLWTIPQSSVTQLAGLLFAANTNIVLPPHSVDTTRKFVKTFAWTVNIVGMTGHFHSRGRNFWVVRQAGGEEVYRNIQWDEPQIKIFGAPSYPSAGYVLPVGERLMYYSDFVNSGPDTIFAGPHVEYQEHSNLFMIYYPAPPDGKTVYDIDRGW